MKWEYVFAGLEAGNHWKGKTNWEAIDALFTELGADGWELVGKVELPIGRETTFRQVFKCPVTGS